MGTYRKKPVEIEARQLRDDTAGDIYHWIAQNTQGSFDPHSDQLPASGVSIDPANGSLLIATLEGVMRANPGDWIIRGVEGEFYPCKPEIFAETYEPAETVTVTDEGTQVTIQDCTFYAKPYPPSPVIDEDELLPHLAGNGATLVDFLRSKGVTVLPTSGAEATS